MRAFFLVPLLLFTQLVHADGIADDLRARIVAGQGLSESAADSMQMRSTVARFYRVRGGEPVWFDGLELRPEATQLVRELHNASLHGLDSAHYRTPELLDAVARIESDAFARGTREYIDAALIAEHLLTDAWFLYGAHLLEGRFATITLYPDWIDSRRKGHLIEQLESGLSAGNVADALARLAPGDFAYRRMQRELRRATALLDDDPANARLSNRIARIRVNMERMRRLPAERGDPHVLVNIPAFELAVVDAQGQRLVSPVVVGSPEHPTPAFSVNMTAVVVNPVWYLPQRIAAEEVLPALQEDPRELERRRLTAVHGWGENAREVDVKDIDWSSISAGNFPYRLQQAPGGSNPLGRYQFMSPNPHNVYIHDTPARYLFDHEQRAFSAGCVRMHDAELLASELLSDVQWAEAQAAAEHADAESTIRLEAPVPVHFVYLTMTVDEQGRVEKWPDVYDIDRRLLDALDTPPPRGSDTSDPWRINGQSLGPSH